MRLLFTIIILICFNIGQSQSILHLSGSPPSGAPPFTPNAVDADGTDYLNLNDTAITGLSNTKTISLSAWINPDIDNVSMRIISIKVGAANRLLVSRSSDNTINIHGRNSSSVVILDLRSTDTILASEGWVHIYITIDLANAANRKIYINGSADTWQVTTYTDDTLDLTSASTHDTGIAANADGTSSWDGQLSEIWFDDTYFDDPTKFISGGCPVDLGSDGSTPTSTQPVIYLPNAAATYNVNAGSGQNFTLNGTFTDTTAPCE